MNRPLTILDHMIAEQRFLTPVGPLSSRVVLDHQERIAIGYDIGNQATKVAALAPDGKLLCLRIPTAYQPATEIRGGEQLVTYRVGTGAPFWIGDVALSNDGQALSLGSIAQRLTDQRLREFTAACLAEVLVSAGYPAGSYDLALGFAIPNMEIVMLKGDDKGTEKLGVAPATAEALVTYVKSQRYTVTRSDERGRDAVYELHVANLIPQGQSIGTFTAWSRTPTGQLVTDVEAIEIVDIGGGDLQLTTVFTKPYRMTTQRLGDGTVRIARALKDRYPFLSDVAAQQALITKSIRISGRRRDISADVDAVVSKEGQDILAQIVPVLRQRTRFGLFTGGGTTLLERDLLQKAKAENSRRGEEFELINHGTASLLNATGSLFGVIFRAAKK